MSFRADEPAVLRTARMLLRPLRLEDLDEVFAISSDPEFAFFAMRNAVTRESVAEGLAVRAFD